MIDFQEAAGRTL